MSIRTIFLKMSVYCYNAFINAFQFLPMQQQWTAIFRLCIYDMKEGAWIDIIYLHFYILELNNKNNHSEFWKKPTKYSYNLHYCKKF